MRAPVSDLPVAFDAVSLRAGEVEIVRDLEPRRSRRGAPTVLLGPNGSGKSTLLRLAMGLARADVRAHHLGRTRRAAASGCAMVFQRPVMLRRSAAGNIATRYALPASRRTMRASPSCWRRSALPDAAPTARPGCVLDRRAAADRARSRVGRFVPKSCFSTSRRPASIRRPRWFDRGRDRGGDARRRHGQYRDDDARSRPGPPDRRSTSCSCIADVLAEDRPAFLNSSLRSRCSSAAAAFIKWRGGCFFYWVDIAAMGTTADVWSSATWFGLSP